MEGNVSALTLVDSFSLLTKVSLDDESELMITMSENSDRYLTVKVLKSPRSENRMFEIIPGRCDIIVTRAASQAVEGILA